jgi:hypothetical protein
MFSAMGRRSSGSVRTEFIHVRAIPIRYVLSHGLPSWCARWDPGIPILKESKAKYTKAKYFYAQSCDAGVTQNLLTLPKLTSITVIDE